MATPHPSTITVIIEPHEFLVCDICAEPYDNEIHQPKFLECLHTFCSHCLILLASQGRDKTGTISCPNCRQPTHVPEDGVGGLRTNFYIEQMKAYSATLQQAATIENTEGCYKHGNQPLFFFCETCGLAICRHCTVVDHANTSEHSIVNLTDAVAKRRHLLQDQLNASRMTRTKVKRVVLQIESDMKGLQADRDSVIKDLRSVIQFAHQEIEQYEHEVTGVILQQYDAKQRTLLDEQLRFHQASMLLDKYIGHSEAVQNTCGINEMTYITGKLEKVTGSAETGFASFHTGNGCLTSDMVTEGTAVNDNLCHLRNKHLKSILPTSVVIQNGRITAGFKSLLTLVLLNDEGNRVPVAVCFLTIKISDRQGIVLPVTVSAAHPVCVVTFTPQRSGKHDISVLYLGLNLRSKQTHISVSSNDPVLKIGGLGDGNGTFNSPRDIAIDNNNCLYVADTGNGLIQKFSAEGEFIKQFRVNENNKDCTLFTLTLDLNKRLIVCTEILNDDNGLMKGNTVLLFNLEGQLQRKYTLSEVSCPLCIAVNSRGNVLLSDVHKKCLFEVDREGNILRRFGDFAYPGCICTRNDGLTVVSDVHNDCIKIFNSDGTVRNQFGTFGTGEGHLQYPFGITTDGENILVAEGNNNRVQVFKWNGTPVSIIESKGDPLDTPRGLTVTEDGYVYVVDRDNHCIKKYKYREMHQQKFVSAWQK